MPKKIIYADDAIDALKAMALPLYLDSVCEDIWERDRTLNNAIDVMRGLPSAQPDLSSYSDKLWRAAYERGKAEAQPQRMRGRWEPKIDRWGDTLTLTEGYNCSECHAWVDGEYSFCPWCGADMREGEQDEQTD